MTLIAISQTYPILCERRKEGRKEERRGGRKEERKEGRKDLHPLWGAHFRPKFWRGKGKGRKERRKKKEDIWKEGRKEGKK